MMKVASTAAAFMLLMAVVAFPALAQSNCQPLEPSKTVSANNLKSGDTFHDCADCPEMVVIPHGSFEMGDLSGGGLERESPVHTVIISKPLAVGKFEISFAEWDLCVDAGGCSYRPDDLNWGRGKRAIGDVSWNDVKEYTVWLSCITEANYRLPSEAEWEYIARAGTRTNYPWGEEIGSGNALCLHCGGSFPQANPVGQFKANKFGIFDTVGSVAEWVEDCLNNSYKGAPTDGSVWAEGNCYFRITRGGGWYGQAKFLTSSYRNYKTVDAREDIRGFRVVRDLAK